MPRFHRFLPAARQVFAVFLSIAGILSAHAQSVAGRIDPSFRVPGLRIAHALGVLADGRVIVSGNFTNAPSGAGVVVLAADGSVAWRSDSLLTTGQLIAAAPNGDLYVGGDNRVSRFRPPATAPDASFASGNGWRSMDPWAMVAHPDGSLLLAGGGVGGVQMDWQTERGLRTLPLRILPNGLRDTNYSTGLTVGPCTDIALNPDGSYLAARTKLELYRPDGTLDLSFTPGTASNVEMVRRLPSGGYLVGGGAFNSYNGTPTKSLIRITATGALDPSFDFAGRFDVIFDALGAHRPIAVQPDGRILVGLPTGGIRRYLSSGAEDPTWTDPAPTAVARELALDLQGRLHVMGNLEGAIGSQPLYRLAGDASGPVDERPAFTTQPAATTTASAGSTVTLQVQATGQPTPDLQWWFDGAPLAGRTGPVLELSPFSATLAGRYSVTASNRAAVVTSVVALVVLDVGATRPGTPDVLFETPGLQPPVGVAGFVPTTVNPLFWGGAPTPDGGLYLWGNFAFRHADGAMQYGVVRLDPEGVPQPSFQSADAVLDVGGGFLDPEGRLVLGALFRQGNVYRNGVVRLNPDGTPDSTFAPPVLFEGTTQAEGRVLTRQADGSILVAGQFGRVQGGNRAGLIRLHANGSLDTTFTSLPLSSRVSCLAQAPDGDLYLGGSFSLPGATTAVSLIRVNPNGTLDPAFTPITTIGGLVGLEALPDGGVVGLTAGVAQSTPTTLGSLFRLRADGSVDRAFDAGAPQRIGAALLRRADGSFLVGGDAGAAGGLPVIARHLAGGAPDPQYTNAPALTGIRSLLPASDGKTWVITAALPGAVRLQNDTYVPPAPPAILRQPRSIAASGLTVASFRVVADGVRPLSYQWRFNGSPLPGQTTETLNVAPITPASLGAYDVVVTGAGGSGATVSDAARLSNDFPPSVTVQPLVRTNVFVGASVTLSVEATGTAPLAYQWLRNGTAIPGASAPVLVLDNLQLSQAGLYSVRITNTAGSVDSRATDLKVEPLPVPPSFVREAEDITAIAEVSGFCLEPGVAGTLPLGFQWKHDGVELPGQLRMSLCIGVATPADAGLYQLVVTNAQGRAESRLIRVTVIPPVFAITRPPGTLNIIPDRAAVFSVNVRNDRGRPLTYRWQRNGVDIPGATGPDYRLDPPTEADANATFRVIVSDGVETLTSEAAIATARPEVFFCPVGASSIYRIRNAPLPIQLGVEARGFGTMTFQWRRGPAQSGRVADLEAFLPVAGGTTPSLRMENPTDADVGDYFCEVRSPYGTSVVPVATQTGALRVRLVDDDTRPGRVDFGWDYLTLGDVWALNGVEFLPDGRVLVAGAFGNPLVGCHPLRLLARLLPDGRLDPSFTPVTASFGTAVGLVRQPSGRLVIAGDFRGLPGLPDPAPGASWGWARFTAEGALDTTFSTTERPFDGSGGIQISGQSDGRILVVRGATIRRLLPDGARDTAFGGPLPDGSGPGVSLSGEVRRLLVDPADRLIVLTSHSVHRFAGNGQPDASWRVTPVTETLMRCALGADGQVVATGYAPTGDAGAEDLRLVRFLPDGTRDAAFNPAYPAGGTVAGAPGIQSDGRVVVGGTVGTLSARLLPDGSRDAAWEPMASPGGVSSPAYDPYWFFAPDGRALVAAYAFDDGIGFATLGQRQLLRLNNGGNALGQVRLGVPRFVDGKLVFQIPTERGRTYQVQFLGNLGGSGGVTGGWATQSSLTGDGTAQTVSLGTTGSVGFYRVVANP